MPLYDVTCQSCGETEEVTIRLGDLEKPLSKCTDCNGTVIREFPVKAALGFQPFEAYYDESLDMDVGGRREKRQILKALNLQETGDPVKGARNWDKKAVNAVKPMKPRGISFDQKRSENKGTKTFKESDVDTQNAQGKWGPAKMRDF